MWSSLVNQASDMASQATSKATEVASQVSQQVQSEADKLSQTAGNALTNVKESFKEDIEKSEQVAAEKGDAASEEIAAQTGDTCPSSTNNCENNENATEVPESVQNLTKQADQMADKLFSFASTWAGKALEATSETANKVQLIASDVQCQATEKFQEIQDHELVGAAIAQTKNVTKTVVDTIENKTIIGDFNKHQKIQIDQNSDLNKATNGCPWEGYEDWEILKEQILNLSTDKRTFVRNPPAGVSFTFDYQKSSKQAMSVLKEDPNLNKMRFELVPKKLKEENFWKNYFYRVSLIKQSFNLKRLSSSKTSLNETSKASDKSEGNDNNGKGSAKFDELDKDTHNENDNDMFISTELGNTEISADDLQAEMAALGMENTEMDEDWEKELNQELAEYEIVDEEKNDKNEEQASPETADWEKEVNEMLT